MKDPVTPGYRVERDTWERFKELAVAVDAASPSEFLDLLAKYIETDPDSGRPVWWPVVADSREELPIDTA